MNGFDRQRLFAALMLVIIALFVSAGSPFAGRWRRQLRHAAVVAFVIAVALALANIGLWWAGLGLGR